MHQYIHLDIIFTSLSLALDIKHLFKSSLSRSCVTKFQFQLHWISQLMMTMVWFKYNLFENEKG